MKRILFGTFVIGLALLVSAGIAGAQQVGSSKADSDLAVTITPSAKSVSVNQKFTWTVKIRNVGGVAANDVRVENKLPESVRLNNIISSQGKPCKVNFPKVVCKPGIIGSGRSETITFYVQGTQSNTVLKDKVKATAPNDKPGSNNTAVSKVRVR